MNFGSLLRCLLLPVLLTLAGTAIAQSSGVLVIDKAERVISDAPRYPEAAAGATLNLPDDWSVTQQRFDGAAWYRVRFDAPVSAPADEPLVLYVERVCSNLEVQLNGQRIFVGGSMQEPVTRNCHYPQLVTLPEGLLQAGSNVLDVHVRGFALPRVAARQRGAGLSVLQIGPQSTLAPVHARQSFWNVTAVEMVSLVLLVLGLVLLALAWINQRNAPAGYLGMLSIVWALFSFRLWWRDVPLDNATVEFLICSSYTPLLGLGVQFLLSHAGVRSRMLEAALLVQCAMLPLSLLLAGPSRLFMMSGAWYIVLAAEIAGAVALYLRLTWREKRGDFWFMTTMLGLCLIALLVEMAVQRDWLASPPISPLQFVLPLLLITLGARMLLNYARAVRALEASRSSPEVLEIKVREATAEIERNYAQLAELRVEQVTAQERKRIAADLHDDLGAKLLTIVHTSESERISTLAREALEEMRLSVRGLTGKPVRLSDALADWRAETVSRLGQANVEIDWRSLAEDTDQVLPARGYVQTTRILREAVSNIIKHSGASHCKVRCALQGTQFGINIQDNGRGIPMELDGKLDRGHGMSSMKHRAKQMQGQCLVESGPGYGTVIRLTLPLGPEVPAAAAR
jgi:two-component system, NarL family, sensor histidine kinase UhpB